MAEPRIPSLGDSGPSGYSRVRFTADLPATRDLIIREFARIVSLGGVQKIVFELGQPITYEQLIKGAGDAPEASKLEADDLYGGMRNAEIVDFKQKGESLFETLFLAFRFITGRGFVPKGFLFINYQLLNTLLGLQQLDALPDIFGVKAHIHTEIPDDVLALVAVDPLDQDSVRLSLRIPLD